MNNKTNRRANTSRRDFLKASAAGALASGLTVAEAAHVGGSDVLRVGLIFQPVRVCQAAGWKA